MATKKAKKKPGPKPARKRPGPKPRKRVGRPERKENLAELWVRVPVSLADLLAEEAERHKRTRPATLRLILEQWAERVQRERELTETRSRLDKTENIS